MRSPVEVPRALVESELETVVGGARNTAAPRPPTPAERREDALIAAAAARHERASASVWLRALI